MNEMVVGVAAAARVGERYHRARRFDPRTTPSEWLAEAPATDPEETLAAYAQSTGAVVEAGGALGADVLVGTPVGLQVWPRMLRALHALFDAVVHERDVTEPLGRSRRPSRSSCRWWPTCCWSRRGWPARSTASSPWRSTWASRC